MRKCLGVLFCVAALCVMAWSQAPAQNSAGAAGQEQPISAAVEMQTPQDQAPQGATPDTQAPAGQAPAQQAPAQAPAAASQPPANPENQPPAGTEPTPPLPSAPPGAKAPPQKYPRIEWFAGYSFAQAGFFNAGHWAQLNGWNASFTLNATPWIGLIVDGSEYFGNSKIPTGTPAPFQACPPFCPTTLPTFNADTREYNILFGAVFTQRKYVRWVPFGELMFGHDGVRGQAAFQGFNDTEVSSGLALVAGGGVDHPISERFALRLKADYLQTRTDYVRIGKAKQDNLRISVGLVIRSIHKKKRKLEEETQPVP